MYETPINHLTIKLQAYLQSSLQLVLEYCSLNLSCCYHHELYYQQRLMNLRKLCSSIHDTMIRKWAYIICIMSRSSLPPHFSRGSLHYRSKKLVLEPLWLICGLCESYCWCTDADFFTKARRLCDFNNHKPKTAPITGHQGRKLIVDCPFQAFDRSLLHSARSQSW